MRVRFSLRPLLQKVNNSRVPDRKSGTLIYIAFSCVDGRKSGHEGCVAGVVGAIAGIALLLGLQQIAGL